MPETQKPEQDAKGEMAVAAVKADLESVKIKIESFGEMRKANSERFTQVNTLIGELRGMILDLSKNVGRLEVAATKAVDKVEAVQPETLMIEVRRVDAKVEALKANLESNEAMMNQLFEQIKQMRNQMAVFRGVDQIVKMSEDIKGDLTNLQKVQANVERHSDKVESIFMEFQKEFREFNELTAIYKTLEAEMGKVLQNIDQANMRLGEKAQKKEVEELTNKFKKHEEHVSNILTLLTKKSKDMEALVSREIKTYKNELSGYFEGRGKRMNVLIKKLNELVENNQKIGELLSLSKEQLKPEELNAPSTPKLSAEDEMVERLAGEAEQDKTGQ
jgi:hypothetical protein